MYKIRCSPATGGAGAAEKAPLPGDARPDIAGAASYSPALTEEFMRKIFLTGMALLLCVGLCACAAGVPQAEYDRVVAELEELRKQIEEAGQGEVEVQETSSASASAGVDETEIISNISYTIYTTPGTNEFVIFLKNGNGVSIPYLKVDVVFYDQEGNILSTNYSTAYSFLPGQTIVVFVYLPMDESYKKVEHASYELLFNVDMDSFYLDDNLIDKLTVQSNVGSDKGVVAVITNTADVSMDSIELACIYYEDGEVVGFDWGYGYDLSAGSSTSLNFYPPYDEHYSTLPYDDYEIYINTALHY